MINQRVVFEAALEEPTGKQAVVGLERANAGKDRATELVSEHVAV